MKVTKIQINIQIILMSLIQPISKKYLKNSIDFYNTHHIRPKCHQNMKVT